MKFVPCPQQDASGSVSRASSVSHAKVVLFCRQMIFTNADVLASPSAFYEDDDDDGDEGDHAPSFKMIAPKLSFEENGQMRKCLERPEIRVSHPRPCSLSVFEVDQLQCDVVSGQSREGSKQNS